MKYYICEYCYKEYIPKRRGVQKYCSNSCRSNACRIRNSKDSKVKSVRTVNETSVKAKEQMSMSGVGNAVAGTILANTIKTVFTKENNKVATKDDLKQLTERLLGRYHLVKNMYPNEKGDYPYFDLVENIVVYMKPHNNLQ